MGRPAQRERIARDRPFERASGLRTRPWRRGKSSQPRRTHSPQRWGDRAPDSRGAASPRFVGGCASTRSALRNRQPASRTLPGTSDPGAGYSRPGPARVELLGGHDESRCCCMWARCVDRRAVEPGRTCGAYLNQVGCLGSGGTRGSTSSLRPGLSWASGSGSPDRTGRANADLAQQSLSAFASGRSPSIRAISISS